MGVQVTEGLLGRGLFTAGVTKLSCGALSSRGAPLCELLPPKLITGSGPYLPLAK